MRDRNASSTSGGAFVNRSAGFCPNAAGIRKADAKAKTARSPRLDTLDVIPLFYPPGASVTRHRAGLNASVPSCLGIRQPGTKWRCRYTREYKRLEDTPACGVSIQLPRKPEPPSIF